jgi:hypothetical protein
VPAKRFDGIFKSAGKKIQRHLLKMLPKRFSASSKNAENSN